MDEIFKAQVEIMNQEIEEKEKVFFKALLKYGGIEEGVLIANPVHKEDLEKFGGQFLFSKAADVNKIYVVTCAEIIKELKSILGR